MELPHALVECRSRARPRSVHTLRTLTRRVEACLRAITEDHRGAHSLTSAVRKLLKTLSMLRKAAGRVRDLDVQRKLVLEVAGNGRGEQHAYPTEDADVKRIGSFCKVRRKDAADRLGKLLTSHELILERDLEAVAMALKSFTGQEASPAATATRWVRKAGRSDKKLSKSALHEFRKETKLARYLAEMQPDSQTAALLARKLQTIQNAIGKWHDMDLLVATMKPLLGKDAGLRRRAQQRRRKALQSARALLRSHADSFRKHR
jgi:CHAD domain-containing protein